MTTIAAAIAAPFILALVLGAARRVLTRMFRA